MSRIWPASCTPTIRATEVLSNPFHAPGRRPLPYIYRKRIVQLVGAASRLRESYPLRRQVYATMLGLIAATGLRISEALDLRLHDLLKTEYCGCGIACGFDESRRELNSKNPKDALDHAIGVLPSLHSLSLMKKSTVEMHTIKR